MGLSAGGISSRHEATLLSERAAHYLANGPADVVDLIGHVCNLPGAPRVVAEHMAQAMFSGRSEFALDETGRWGLVAAPALAGGAAMTDRLRSMSFVVVDVETTGGQPPSHRITEIAAVVVRDGRVAEVFETLVNPERPIPPFVTKLTRITWDMVKTRPRFAAITPKLLDVLEGNVFVGHNAAYDWHFVAHEIRRASGAEIFGRTLCTAKLARKLLPHLPRRSLDYVANHYGVEISSRHRAGGDAVATAHCLIHLLDDAADRGCETWQDLEKLLRRTKGKKRKRRSALPSPVSKDTTA